MIEYHAKRELNLHIYLQIFSNFESILVFGLCACSRVNKITKMAVENASSSKSTQSLKLGQILSLTRSLGQVIEKSYVHYGGHYGYFHETS